MMGLLDLGSLASYLVYVRQSAMPLNQFTQQVNFLLAALSGAERIFEMMEEEPEPDAGTGDFVQCAGPSEESWKRDCKGYTGKFRLEDARIRETGAPERRCALPGCGLWLCAGEKDP